MSDVFISYAREDEGRAERLANALEAQGWSVWWDRKIPFGQPFDEVIEDALASARCVLVLWSASSIGSRWVLEEAHYAYERNILVPVSVDDVPPPIGFRRAQTTNLVGWDGQKTFPAFRKLLADIHGILEATSEASRPPETPESIDQRRRAVEEEHRAWREPHRGSSPTKRRSAPLSSQGQVVLFRCWCCWSLPGSCSATWSCGRLRVTAGRLCSRNQTVLRHPLPTHQRRSGDPPGRS